MDEPVNSESFSKECDKSMPDYCLGPINDTPVMVSFLHKKVT